MSSRFICVVVCVRISFLFKTEQYSAVWICPVLIALSLDSRGASLVAVRDDGAVNTGYKCLSESLFSEYVYIPGSGVS